MNTITSESILATYNARKALSLHGCFRDSPCVMGRLRAGLWQAKLLKFGGAVLPYDSGMAAQIGAAIKEADGWDFDRACRAAGLSPVVAA